ncbi:Putative Acetyl-coenzyme A synthetase [Rhizopus microsporus]|nr:Putative Acetyl-coenzyme A synthetase [Rhizopus microsporus]
MTVEENIITHPVPPRLLDASKYPKPHIHSMDTYKALWKESVEHPEEFFAKYALELLSWSKPFETVRHGSLAHGDIGWFLEGELNACYNCVDRHALKNPNKIAIIHEGDEPDQVRNITYGELFRLVCQMANTLKNLGVRKGDNVAIYMPMIPEALVAALACARIGAVHSVVFAGFSAESLRDRIIDCAARVVITSDEGRRGGKNIATKRIVDEALRNIGWITGHTYVNYGPLTLGGTTVLFESTPTYPDPSRFWRLVEKHKVTQFYTAPTAIRALRRLGDEWVDKCDLSSLRVIGSVGEPINPEAWEWYYKKVGRSQCAVVDTYWQTETGSIVIAPLPGVTPTKAGSATLPFFGIKPVILDPTTGKVLEGNDVTGVLAISQPWPSMARTVYNNHARFLETYLHPYNGYYFTGDGATRDKDGYIWIRGRVDDVINVSGHRLSTAEIESALILHHSVAEAAVVGGHDDLTGQCIHAFAVLKPNIEDSEGFEKELTLQVRKVIGPFATPKRIYVVTDLPKTRSGKIMRRILRKIVNGEQDSLGDTSTLADPSVVDQLIKRVIGKK